MMSISKGTFFIRYASGDGNKNARVYAEEFVLWSGSPSRKEYLMFWLPRAGGPAVIWTAVWYYAFVKQVSYHAADLTTHIAAGFSILGLVAAFAVPVSAIMCKRYKYIITSQRIILHDRLFNNSRYAFNKDIIENRLIAGWDSNAGSLKFHVGFVSTPDSNAAVHLMLVGISDINAALAAIR